MSSKNLPAKNFQKQFLKLYEGAKNAPSLYIKEKKLSEARKIKNVATAMEAKEIVCQAGKLVCLIEREIAESYPAIPAKASGAMKGKGVAPGANPFKSKDSLYKMRKAYKNLSEAQVFKMSDDAIKKGEVPTRELFLRRGKLAKSAPRVLSYDCQDEYYTPPPIAELAREVMGSIDLDPCSNKYAQKYIKAKEFFIKKDDGLSKEWFGNVWLNPPYVYKEIDRWIDKVIESITYSKVSQAIVLTNNNTETRWAQKLLSAGNCVCFPSGRVRFWNKKGKNLKGPLQGQMIVGLMVNQDRFCSEFAKTGVCCPAAVYGNFFYSKKLS